MAWLIQVEKIVKISLFVLAQLTNVTDRRTPHAGNSGAMHSIERQKSSDFDEIRYTTADSETDDSHVIKN